MNVLQYIQQKHPDLVLRDLLNDPMLKDIELPNPESGELARAFRILQAFCRGEAVPEDTLPNSLETIVRAMMRALRLQAIADADVPRRPQEEGLVEAMLAMCMAMQELGGTKLSGLTYDPVLNRDRAGTINTYRGVAKVLVRFLSVLMRNTAVIESASESTLRSNYSLIRPLARVDLDMGSLETVDDYLFEAAEKGVGTRKDNKRSLVEMTDKATKEGQAAANRKARATLADELSAMLEDIRRTTPAPAGLTKDDRQDPR